MPNDEVETQGAPTDRKRKLWTYLLVAGLMLGEGAAIFVGIKLIGGSGPATGAASTEPGTGVGASLAGAEQDVVEVPVCEVDAFNKMTGKLYVYHLQVAAIVQRTAAQNLKQMVESRAATIRDRVNTVIRRADPKFLNEPGLETIRRQIKFELDKVFGNQELIQEVLLPSLLQSQAQL
jgi:flagellar basal body-associated protein FliL